MKLRRRRDGLSALFDAILFFMIILVATGALFFWASAMTASTTADMSTRDMGLYVSDIQASALGCDVGPVDYTSGGASFTFRGSVYDCLLALLHWRLAGPDCETTGLVAAVREVYGLLVDKPFHFGLNASVKGSGSGLLISERVDEPMNPGAVRWTSAVLLIINGVEAELTLYIWR